MTVCMEYPAKRPYEDEPENAAGRGQKSMQREDGVRTMIFYFISESDGLPMTKLSQLKIDPEFQNQINPPSFEETHQLEMNILKEERVLN